MGQKIQGVWQYFMELTGLNQMELQREMNPIIKKLKIDINNVQMDDLRRIMAHYLRSSLGERLKTVEADEEIIRAPSYTHN